MREGVWEVGEGGREVGGRKGSGWERERGREWVRDRGREGGRWVKERVRE